MFLYIYVMEASYILKFWWWACSFSLLTVSLNVTDRATSMAEFPDRRSCLYTCCIWLRWSGDFSDRVWYMMATTLCLHSVVIWKSVDFFLDIQMISIQYWVQNIGHCCAHIVDELLLSQEDECRVCWCWQISYYQA